MLFLLTSLNNYVICIYKKVEIMKRKSTIIFILISIFLLKWNLVSAQGSNEFVNRLTTNINRYFIEQAHDILYIHTDRAVYFAGERVLYRITVSDAATLRISDRSKTCSLILTGTNGKEVYNSSSMISNGSVVGSFIIPSDVEYGAYILKGVLYNGDQITSTKPFTKELIISNPVDQLMLDYKLDKKNYEAGNTVHLHLNAYGNNSKPISKVEYEVDLIISGSIAASKSSESSKQGLCNIEFVLPDKISNDVYFEVHARKRKMAQDFSCKIPLSQENQNRPEQKEFKGIVLNFNEISDNRIKLETQYSGDKYEGNMQVIIAIFRKGIMYWSAQGTLDHTHDLSIPVMRIPSGILDVVVFSTEGDILAEKMVYRKRTAYPGLMIELDNDEFTKRQLVKATITFLGEKSVDLSNSVFSVSVCAADLLPRNDILMDDYFLIDADLRKDHTEFLSNSRNSKDRESSIQDLLRGAERNSYNWDEILGKNIEKNTQTEEAGVDEEYRFNFLPDYFHASRMADFSIGIRDKRLPGSNEENYKTLLENGIPVLDVIKTIKPYSMYGNSIIFSGGTNSINNQQGALIIIDNQRMGEDVSVLKSISPTDVESIRIATNAGDMQQYTGLNVVGIIEITMKGYGQKSRLSTEDQRDAMVRTSKGVFLEGYPDYSIDNDNKSISTDNRGTLYWNPDFHLDQDNKTSIEFYSSDMPGKYVISIQGMPGTYPVAARYIFEVK